ncbi:chaperonin GroEL [Patescibacteria group bacterium]|nr:chaperonin GroEL [Patescibacteria group bacterium]
MSVQIYSKDTFSIIKSAVDKTVDLIKPTFGPASNKVIISKLTHGMVVDDGVQIARDLELTDPAENAIMKVVRETAIKTNDRVGDGTTGALIILQAIFNQIVKLSRRDTRKIEKELKIAFDQCKAQLLKEVKPVKTKEDLLKVATVSFDDKKIAKLIADAWQVLGENGVLTVDRSGTMETFSELTEGITLNRGYVSPYMITNPQRMEGVIEKPYILITDYRLTEANDVIGIMNKLAAKQILSLVIICDNIEQNALATLILNKMQGKFNVIAINVPSGDNQTVMLEDMALMLGGKFFSEKKGDKIDSVEILDLGRSERFIARRNESVIIKPKGKKSEISKVIFSLKVAVEEEKNERVKTELQQRLAKFSNKVGVIKVGAPTENEVNALRYKVEDAINAVHAAFKGGVVAGGGIALSNLSTSSEILNAALKVPFQQLKTNVGIDEHRDLKPGEAINVVTGEIGQWQKVGVMDPVDVLIAQIESAVSIASLLITTTGIICEKPQQLKQE